MMSGLGKARNREINVTAREVADEGYGDE